MPPLHTAEEATVGVDDDIHDLKFANGGCCFWMPCHSAVRSIWWQRIATDDTNSAASTYTSYKEPWWTRGWKTVREWSELVAGPKWKTFIRRFKKNKTGNGGGKFYYDPSSYALNFDEGPGRNGYFDNDSFNRNFSSRRNTALPPLKFPLISRICLLGLTGYLALMCSYKGIELGSPTLASAISNLTPAFTFILAVFFRMEKVAFRSSGTQAKIIGTITSISGALVITFYKGPKIISSSTWTSSSFVLVQRPLGSSQSNWTIGGLLEAIAYLLASFWYIIQSQVMKIYPEEIVVIFFYNMSVALIYLPVCLLAEPKLSSWRLTTSISVVAVLYSGLFGFSFSSAVHTWGVRLKGPVFVAIFRPTSVVITVVMSAIFLGEAVYLGSVIGAVILTTGLYAVLWGKAKEEEEEEMTDDDSGLSNLGPLSSGTLPLLQS